MKKVETIALCKTKILCRTTISLILAVPVILFLVVPLVGLLAVAYIPESLVKRIEPMLSEIFYPWLTHFLNMVKLFDGEPGLEITNAYLMDNSSVAYAGRIAWENVISMDRIRIGEHEGITILVEDPTSILDTSQGFRRMLLRLNMAVYHSPAHVSCDCINASCDQLFAILVNWREGARKTPSENAEPDARYLVPYVESGYEGHSRNENRHESR